MAASAAGMAMASALFGDIVGYNPATTRPALPPVAVETVGYDPPVCGEKESYPYRRRAGLALRHDMKAGVRLMVSKPWRIQRALFGARLGALPTGIDELITYASRRCRSEEAAGLAGHWSYNFSRHLAARQARLALRALRRTGATDLDQLW